MTGYTIPGSPFDPTSRYAGLAPATWVDAQCTGHAYVPRRFIPPAASYATISTHQVIEGERYDILAAQYLGDPLQFWRLADANGVADPRDLETPGRVVAITLPAGLPGYPSD